MKIAFCLFRYFPYGGLQRDFLNFLKEAASRGHECEIYCMSWEDTMPPDFKVNLLTVEGRSNNRKAVNFGKQLQTALAHNPPDIIFGFNKIPGLDLYYAADSCYEEKARNQRSFLYRMTSRYRDFVANEKAVFSKDSSTHILLISELEKKKFVHYYQTPAKRMFMLPPGISRDRCFPADGEAQKAAMRQELGIQAHEHALLFVGSGFRKKGLDRAIRALAVQPESSQKNIRLFVVGKDREEKFKTLARRLGVENAVTFLGGRDDIPKLLLMADLLIHPALDEAAGIIILEAVVAGLPVLLTDVCGYAHHVSAAKAGMVLDSPFSQKALNKALQVLEDKSTLRQWHDNALAYSRENDLYSMHKTGIDYLEKLVAGKS